jgi:hypothetical protein
MKLTQNGSTTIRAEIIKLLEENVITNLHDLEFSNEFLDVTPKERATKKKIRNH